MSPDMRFIWYVESVRKGEQGPFCQVEILRFLEARRMRPTDRVRTRISRWEPVSQVSELVPDEFLEQVQLWEPA